MSLPIASVLLTVLGAIGSFIGLLLRYPIGRGILLLFLVVFCVLLMIEGELPEIGGGAFDWNGNPDKVSRFLLYSGGSCFSFALLCLVLHLLGVKQ